MIGLCCTHSISNTDNTLAPCYNNSTNTDYLIGDPVETNGNWDYAAYGSNQRISQFYYNLLTNARGADISDPRMSKIVPVAMANVKLDATGKLQSYSWQRSLGVDSYGEAVRLGKGGATSIVTPSYAAANTDIIYAISDATDRSNFIAAQVKSGRPYKVNDNNITVTYVAGSIFINSTNYLYAGDPIYVNLRSNALATTVGTSQSEMDLNWYLQSTDALASGVVGSTGSFQVRPVSDQEILTYHEMCFIKAEAEMRKGNSAEAYTAYKAGIQAHIDMMQTKLTEWKADGYNNPDMWPMDDTAINNYLQSNAVCQNAGSLTMADIMLQKYIAMGCSIENWNDMRRFNFSAGNVGSFGVIYSGYDRGPLFAGNSVYTGSSKTDPRYWQRRWQLPTTLELNYNMTNALAVNPHASDPNIWSMPVWWDSATDDEYYGYLQK